MWAMIWLFALILSQAHAQVFEGPVSRALAGSGRAGLDASEGTYLNPALAGILPKSEFAVYYGDGQADQNQHRQDYGISISENEEDDLAGGELSYIRLRNTGVVPTPVNGDLWHAAMGRLFFNKLALGVSVVHLTQSPEGPPAYEQWNGSLGALFMVNDRLGFAYVFDNPVNESKVIPIGLRLLPQQSFGVYYALPYYARVRLDVIRQEQDNPGQRWDVHGSIESQFSDYFIFRLGARWDDIYDQHFITTGLGFNGPRLKLDYAFEKNVYGTGGAVHSVDLRTTF